MSLVDFAQFGGVIFLGAVLAFIVREFLRYLRRQEDNFTNIIRNHLTESNRVLKDLEKTQIKLVKVLEEFLRFFKK